MRIKKNNLLRNEIMKINTKIYREKNVYRIYNLKSFQKIQHFRYLKTSMVSLKENVIKSR